MCICEIELMNNADVHNISILHLTKPEMTPWIIWYFVRLVNMRSLVMVIWCPR